MIFGARGARISIPISLTTDRGLDWKDYNAEAEQTYRLSSQLWPANINAVTGLSELLVRTGRADEARRLMGDFARNHPDQRSAVDEMFRADLFFTAPPAKPHP